jgi:hypothetical protein
MITSCHSPESPHARWKRGDDPMPAPLPSAPEAGSVPVNARVDRFHDRESRPLVAHTPQIAQPAHAVDVNGQRLPAAGREADRADDGHDTASTTKPASSAIVAAPQRTPCHHGA